MNKHNNQDNRIKQDQDCPPDRQKGSIYEQYFKHLDRAEKITAAILQKSGEPEEMDSLGVPGSLQACSRQETTSIDISTMAQHPKEQKKTAPTGRKSKLHTQRGDYKDTYFARIDFSDRQPLYITRDTHGTLMRIVSIIGGQKATISSYVENIILRHLESFREEINRLYNDRYTPPVK